MGFPSPLPFSAIRVWFRRANQCTDRLRRFGGSSCRRVWGRRGFEARRVSGRDEFGVRRGSGRDEFGVSVKTCLVARLRAVEPVFPGV